jgi:hypothetical protein
LTLKQEREKHERKDAKVLEVLEVKDATLNALQQKLKESYAQ